jgi:predicted tellurium resistance membrane protein TerC
VTELAWLLDPSVLASFITLSALEIVLGVDNVVFIALLAARLPPEQRSRARAFGLALALGTRLLLLASITWLAHLTEPVLSLGGFTFSWRDLVLLGGGTFLLFKGTREIHLQVDGIEQESVEGRRPGIVGTIIQIALFDVVFSIDSVITAVGIVDDIRIMIAAIVGAMVVMLAAAGVISSFIERYPSVRMLVLSFLLLIGMMLVADGFGVHMPRGYIYAAMGFSVLVESLNLIAARRRRLKKDVVPHHAKAGASPAGR